MSEQEAPLGDLAEKLMAEKREELDSEEQARELYDIPTETGAELAEQQEGEQS